MVPILFSWICSIILWRLKKSNYNEEIRTETDISLDTQSFNIKDIVKLPVIYWWMCLQEITILNFYMNFIYMGTYYGIARFNLHYLESKDMPA